MFTKESIFINKSANLKIKTQIAPMSINLIK